MSILLRSLLVHCLYTSPSLVVISLYMYAELARFRGQFALYIRVLRCMIMYGNVIDSRGDLYLKVTQTCVNRPKYLDCLPAPGSLVQILY